MNWIAAKNFLDCGFNHAAMTKACPVVLLYGVTPACFKQESRRGGGLHVQHNASKADRRTIWRCIEPEKRLCDPARSARFLGPWFVCTSLPCV